MTLLVPIMLFGWVPLTVFLFFRFEAHKAVIYSVIGGWLFLPMTGYNLPGLPAYIKSTAIALGLILGGRLSGKRRAASFRWRVYDLPMVLWCFCPFATSLSNQLGLYDGLSASFNQIMTWGIPYLAGRIYFDTTDKLKDLCLGIIVGGLIYVPLCLYEIRMSPQLSKTVYGFFAHEWIQHKRYGGWRPIVFMQHGLMVALWMAVSSTVAFWFWRSREIRYLKKMPMILVVVVLAITAVLSKSASGWFALVLGCGIYFFHRRFKTRLPLFLLCMVVLFYPALRVSGFISGEGVENIAAYFFDAKRVGSLGVRLLQEDLFIKRALESPLFGWGGYSRGWPVDPVTGRQMIKMVDSLWLIVFSSKGFFGLISFLSAMLTGPWLILRSLKKKMPFLDSSIMLPILMAVVVLLFMIDSLFNAMINPVYIISSGALVCCYSAQSKVLRRLTADRKKTKMVN